MTALDALRLRMRALAPGAPGGRAPAYVLCWLQQALRADENPVVDAAVALGNRAGLPVVVLHTLENRYPYASARLHRFILEASAELGPGVAARGLRFVRYVRPAAPAAPSTVGVALALAADAAAVVLDDVPLFVTRAYADALAAGTDRPVWAVDACCAVPMNALGTPVQAAKAFRALHTPLRADHLALDLTQTPGVPPYDGPLAVPGAALSDGGLDAADVDALVGAAGVDPTVAPVAGWSGRRSAALARLDGAVARVVPRYKWTRNNPAEADGTSRLSPWLHMGVLSPLEVARRVHAAVEAGAVHPAARWKFLDETLTWRELAYHRARHEPGFARYATLPAWARETLADHAGDPRDARPFDALVHGETGDETWDAAQRQFVAEGWMNNNLRMVWVTQLLRWCPTPEAAYATACYLNDRFSLDGRDPATYGGIRWGFGEAAPGRERPVYGRVPRKGDAALRRRAGVPAWLAEQAARPVERAALPDDLDAALAPYL